MNVAPMDVRFDESSIMQLVHFTHIVTAAFQPHSSAFSSVDLSMPSSCSVLKRHREKSPMMSNNLLDAMTMEVTRYYINGDVRRITSFLQSPLPKSKTFRHWPVTFYQEFTLLFNKAMILYIMSLLMTVRLVQVTVGDVKLHFPCHGSSHCLYKGDRGSIPGVIRSPTSQLSSNTSGSGRTFPGSTDCYQTYFVFVVGKMSISTAAEEEVEVSLRGDKLQDSQRGMFRRCMDENEGAHRMAERAQAEALCPSKVYISFSMEAYLTDVRSMMESQDFIPILKVLEPVNVAARLWSTLDMAITGPEQHLQVCLFLITQML